MLVTSNATGAGDSAATLIMIDGQGRPVTWEANGHFDGNDGGLGNLLDLDRDSRPALRAQVQGMNHGEAETTSASRYDPGCPRDTHSRCFVGEPFPIIRPVGAQIRGEDLTDAVVPGASRYTIASLVPGRKENCSVQVTLRWQPGGGWRWTAMLQRPKSSPNSGALVGTAGDPRRGSGVWGCPTFREFRSGRAICEFLRQRLRALLGELSRNRDREQRNHHHLCGR